MIEPTTSLAFSVHSNPGVYALLLGSGVSRAAEVPTGWEIINDLITQLAELQGEDPEPTPSKWFEETYGEEPNYSRLLDQLAHSREERRELLRPYFEPNEEEREQGVKMPTEGHEAIAELVEKGSIKIIVTTNFDRLLEQALEERGITPTVIASPDAAEGALPLAHASCTILKVHGDYLDTRIKNTPEELAEYDDRIDSLLDQIFDEYGLIVCGWSGEWDQALISALERCESRRFSTYWAAYQGEVTENAERLIEQRDADTIEIEGADSFFHRLNEKVTSLQQLDRPHPLSAKMAVASLKRYIVSEEERVALHDLVFDEVEKVADKLDSEQFSAGGRVNEEELARRVHQYESVLEILLPLVVHGCYWGQEQHRYLWNRAIERLANKVEHAGGKVMWLKLRLYPALLLLYSGGIATVAGGRYGNLLSLLNDPQIQEAENEGPALSALTTYDVVEARGQSLLPEGGNRRTPLSDRLFEVLRDPLKGILPGEEEYDESFDRFEYLRSLLFVDDQFEDLNSDHLWVPDGRFCWKRYSSLRQEIENEVEEEGEEWGPIKEGAFSGSTERFWAVKQVVDEITTRPYR